MSLAVSHTPKRSHCIQHPNLLTTYTTSHHDVVNVTLSCISARALYLSHENLRKSNKFHNSPYLPYEDTEKTPICLYVWRSKPSVPSRRQICRDHITYLHITARILFRSILFSYSLHHLLCLLFKKAQFNKVN